MADVVAAAIVVVNDVADVADVAYMHTRACVNMSIS